MQESAKNLTSRSLSLLLRKKEKKAEFWPRLTKEKVRTQFIKTDFSKWVDEDEQDGDVPAVDDEMEGMGGMGGMPGMGGMGGMPGMGGMGGMPGMGGMGGMPGMPGGMGGMGGMDLEAVRRPLLSAVRSSMDLTGCCHRCSSPWAVVAQEASATTTRQDLPARMAMTRMMMAPRRSRRPSPKHERSRRTQVDGRHHPRLYERDAVYSDWWLVMTHADLRRCKSNLVQYVPGHVCREPKLLLPRLVLP